MIKKRFLFTCLFLVLTNAVVAQMPKKKALQPKGKVDQSSDIGKTVEADIPRDVDAAAQQANVTIFVKKLLLLAKSWNWAGFNWTTLYSYFNEKISYDQFLSLTQNGNWQSIENLAQALIETGHFSDQPSALFFIFSALNSQFLQISSEMDNTHENYHLLNTMSQVQSQVGFVQSLDSLPINPIAFGSQQINSLMSSLSSHFINNPLLLSVTLANTLGGILAVLENELPEDVQVGSPDAAISNQSPTVSTVLSYISQSHQNQALAILIGFPFDQQPMGASNAMMKAEAQLQNVVSQILQPLWQACNDLQPALAQLAILVFHFNFLQQLQTGPAQTATPSIPSYEDGFEGCPWSEIESYASAEIVTEEWYGRHRLVRRLMPAKEIHRKHYAKVPSCISSREICDSIRREMVSEGLISEHIEFTPSMTVSSFLSKLYGAVEPHDWANGGRSFVKFLRILLNYPESRALAVSMLGLIITQVKPVKR